MTQRCVILSAGPYIDPKALSGYLLPEDIFIAADGGWRLAQQMGIRPSILVADFDSLPQTTFPQDVEVLSLPVEKDVTDTARAMQIGFDSGCRTFLLLGCTGGRLDHFQAALATAADYVNRGCEVILADEKNEIHLLGPGSYIYPACPDEKISLFAYGDTVSGLFLNGLKYELTDYTLTPFDPLCVSNEWIGEDACLSFKTGVLMLYFSKD